MNLTVENHAVQQLARSLPAEAEDLAPVVEGCYGDAMDRPIVQ